MADTRPDSSSRAGRTAGAGAAAETAAAETDAGGAEGFSGFSGTGGIGTSLKASGGGVMAGASAVPYHSDGELCQMYTAEEFLAVADAAAALIFYHRTYVNHLNTWIRRVSNIA